MPEFVFPHCAAYEDEIEKISGINRLYAYPAEPRFENNSNVVILDSGAFGLSRAGLTMNMSYMMKLSEHYKKFHRDNTLCIAPDEFLNPVQSMMNLVKWRKKGLYSNVTPVIQRSVKSVIDIHDMKEQAEFYREYADTICIALAGIYGEDALDVNLKVLLEYMKNTLNFRWIHILGVGYSLEDIKNWKKVGFFDSMDSRSYFITKEESAFGSFNPIENIRRIVKCMEE